MRSIHSFVVLLAAMVVMIGCTPLVISEGLANGEPPEIRWAERLRTYDGATLQLEQFEPPNGAPMAVIVALHSFNDHCGFCRRAAAFLAQRRIAVFAFDQRGFGSTTSKGYWPGTRSLSDDLRAAVAAVRKVHQREPIYVFGESMGASVVIVTMAETPDPDVAGLILASPAVREDSVQNRIVNAGVWIAAHLVPWYELDDNYFSSIGVNDPAVTEELNADPLAARRTRIDAGYGMLRLMLDAIDAAPKLNQRMLVLYGARDAVIPIEAVTAFLASLPDAADNRRTFAYYPEGFHKILRDGRGEIFWRDIASWIGDPVAPLPSGAEFYAVAAETCLAARACPRLPQMTVLLEP